MTKKGTFLAICGLWMAVLIVASQAHATDTTTYTTGTLVRAESCLDNCTRIVVQVGEVVYVAIQTATFHWQAYAASEFEENGPVDVRIDGPKLFLKRPNGKELKAKIVKRVRIGANGQAKLEALLQGRTRLDDQRSATDLGDPRGSW